MHIQTNALRGKYMRDIVDPTVNEIHDNIKTVFGPGAADAFITKDHQPYYTRDGLEVLESMFFDNKLSEHIRKIIYQAAYRQGKVIGDGTTTMIMYYTNLYKAIRETVNENDPLYRNMNRMRDAWTTVNEMISDSIKSASKPLDPDTLLAMLYTCTQDPELAHKIFTELGAPIMNQAYITVEKSNIDTDFDTTVYEEPLIKATRQWTIWPIQENEDYTVIFHCNGQLSIEHPEVILGLMGVHLSEQGSETRLPLNVMILCNGMNEKTRKTLKEVNTIVGNNALSRANANNVTIYTLDDWRSMDNETIEDISTIITEEKGIGGLVNAISFESLLYQALAKLVRIDDIPELKTFDCDIAHIDKVQSIFLRYGKVQFDDAEGIRIKKPLGPVAQARYQELKDKIASEKSAVTKFNLSRRMKKSFGQFINVEVGSKLIKDSQRKYELILDGIISAAEAARNGILIGNSLIHAYQATEALISEMEDDANDDDTPSEKVERKCAFIIHKALRATIFDIIENALGKIDPGVNDLITKEISGVHPDKFNLNVTEGYKIFDGSPDEHLSIIPPSDDGGESLVKIPTVVTEPVGAIVSILENSTIPLELAMARTFQVENFMQNFIN